MYDQDILKSPQKSTSIFDEDLLQHSRIFIQPKPAYGIRDESGWRLPHGTCGNSLVYRHLNGEIILGTYARWYSEYGILDIDDLRSSLLLESIVKTFNVSGGLGSIVYETSPGSYHILFKIHYNGKPVTSRLFQTIMGPYVQRLSASMRERKDLSGIELYPQEKRIIRVPFHPDCKILGRNLETLEAKMEAWNDLIALDLKQFDALKRAENRLKGVKSASVQRPTKGAMKEAMELYEYGMDSASESRYFSQRKVAQYLWRLNLTPDQAKAELMHWVCNKTNGFSKDADSINRGDWRVMQQVQREHETLIDHIWAEFERYDFYPATTHNSYHGWYTAEDLLIAAKWCNGKIPRFKFLSQLLAFFNAKNKTRLNVHRHKLVSWSSHKTYLKNIEELETNGFFKREKQYLAGEFSKVIELNVRPTFTRFDDAKTLTDGLGQALTFGESLEEVGKKEIYQMLTQNGVSKQAVYQFIENRSIV